MSKIETLTYVLDYYNLQTRIMSFPDHGKWLEEVVVRFALFMNASTKNFQMKHFPFPRHSMIYRHDMYNLQVTKKTSKR